MKLTQEQRRQIAIFLYDRLYLWSKEDRERKLDSCLIDGNYDLLSLVDDMSELMLSFSEKIADAVAEESNLDDPHFLGKKGYDKPQDQERLNKQMHVVFAAMVNAGWQTQQQIADRSGACITSLRARFSDLRSKRWGGHQVLSERLKDGKGTWVYKLIPNEESLTYKNFMADLQASMTQSAIF